MTRKPPPKQRAKPDAADRVAYTYYEHSIEANHLATRIRRAIKAAEKQRDAAWNKALDTAQDEELARTGSIRHPAFILDDIMSRMKGTP